jgi:hypothetical protein
VQVLLRFFHPKPWRNIMPNSNSTVVGLFCNHLDAENAVKELQKSGYDMKKLSVIGKDFDCVAIFCET